MKKLRTELFRRGNFFNVTTQGHEPSLTLFMSLSTPALGVPNSSFEAGLEGFSIADLEELPYGQLFPLSETDQNSRRACGGVIGNWLWCYLPSIDCIWRSWTQGAETILHFPPMAFTYALRVPNSSFEAGLENFLTSISWRPPCGLQMLCCGMETSQGEKAAGDLHRQDMCEWMQDYWFLAHDF